MNFITKRFVTFTGLCVLAGLTMVWPGLLFAQVGWSPGTTTTADAQRNALNSVRAEVDWLQNATRTASNYAQGGYEQVGQRFLALRAAYNRFKGTLTPNQWNHGANDLADLDAGLDILQETFSNYQDDVARGQNPRAALRNMCQILSQGVKVWLQELNKDSSRLRVGLR